MHLTDDQVNAWVARQLASAPPRDDAWRQSVLRFYGLTPDTPLPLAA